MVKLRKWQQEAYKSWKESGCKGVVEAATGSGKTRFAVHCMKDFPGNILIIVPRVSLISQWEAAATPYFGQIGRLFGGEKTLRRVTVGVINTVRSMRIKNCDLIIFDEFHHSQAELAARFLRNNPVKNFLGISASPHRDRPADEFPIENFPVVYSYSKQQAIKDKVLAKEEIIMFPVHFDEKQKEKYSKLQAAIDEGLNEYENDFNLMMQAVRNGYEHKASKAVAAIARRKKMIYQCYQKRKAVTGSAETEIKRGSKVIIFDESIENIECFCERLKHLNIVKYHSKMKKKEKEEALRKFKSGESRIIVSAKCLEEGIDVPDCDVALIVNGTSKKLQNIQRSGRVLRCSEGKTTGVIYHYYVKDTVDERWLKNRL